MTKTELKFVRSLAQQKYRKEHNAYIVEGDKNAKEWIKFPALIQKLIATEKWIEEHNHRLYELQDRISIATATDIEKISVLHTPTNVVIVAQIPALTEINLNNPAWSLMLSSVRDPGNLGTIIRIADWFGIDTVICSKDSADTYNPKTVQASMGGLLRVKVTEANLYQLLKDNPKTPVYAACLNGENINSMQNINPGIILLGNESQGLPDDLINLAQRKVTIPQIGGAESLNVAVAAGIICNRLIG